MEDNSIPESEAPLTGIDRDRQTLTEAREKGKSATLKAYVKLSGPGWLQSAITLGGGSLSSSLYLGVLVGMAALWLQPLTMIIGVIMLSAIGYVTLSTGERPFKAIREHVNPVLGWGWLIAALLANCVWSLPQFGLAFGSMSQNLMPGTFGKEAMDPYKAQWIVSGSIALFCIIVVFCYDSRGMAVKFFNILLKVMVAVVVISFFGVVVYLSIKGKLNWDSVGGGLVPDFRLFWTPASTFNEPLKAVGAFSDFWTAKIIDTQQDVMVAAAATAVGINMTFLLPYSMLKRGWNKDFRGLAVFDLSTGLFIPFILATGCVVIASASQFHTKPALSFGAEDTAIAVLADRSLTDEDVQKVIRRSYGDWMSEADMAEFATDASGKVQAEMAKAEFAALDGEKKKRARLMAVLDGASEGKLRKVEPKLIGDCKGLALARIKKEMGTEKFNEAIRVRAFALVPDDVDTAYKNLIWSVGDKKFTYDATKRLMEQGYWAKAEDQLVAELPLADRKIAAMIAKRDSIDLAQALSPLAGEDVANYVFGIGVVGMAVSSIIILMLINGFCVCEMFDKPSHGWLYRFGCILPAVGIAGPFLWKQAAPYLAIPTSVSQFIVIPIAYTAFAILLNQKKLLGDNLPRASIRWLWNLLMIASIAGVTTVSVWMAYKQTSKLPGFWGGGWVGLGAIGLFVLLVIIAQVRMKKPPAPEA